MAKRLQHVLCTVHNLEFGYDDERVRALGQQGALMRCPVCAREEYAKLKDQLLEVEMHRDVLLKAIDIKRLTQRVR